MTLTRKCSRRRVASESTTAIIDRLLMRPRAISVNGEATQLPTIRVIMLRLVQKEMAGSLRAGNALLKYREFAERRLQKKLEVRFAESDYTRSFVEEPGGGHAR